MQFICNICVAINYEEISTPRKVPYIRLYFRTHPAGDRNAAIKIFNESLSDYFGLQLDIGRWFERQDDCF